jgi:repressor LexA
VTRPSVLLSVPREHPSSASDHGRPTGFGKALGERNASSPISRLSSNGSERPATAEPATTARRKEREKPRRAGLCLRCAEEDSNLHPVIPDQALNLARLPIPPSAQAGPSIAPAARAVESVHGARYCPEHVFDAIQETGKRMDLTKDLTKRQQEIFDFIKRYSAKYGYPPTVRDIGKAVGLASSSTVHAHLSNLEKVGLLRRDPSKPRALELLDRATSTVADAAKSVVRPSGLPLVGNVAAGEPIVAEENVEDFVQVPELAGGDEGEFVLSVRGDSMKNAGILAGDYVVVRKQETATNGDIVVALVGEDATVKRFFREEDHVRLQPENEAMEPIRTREARVIGRVVGVMRKVA